jgi:hypothetical protein
MKDALQAILINTANRTFNGDFVYKSGVLANIELALGKKEFDRIIKTYL